MIQEWIYKPNIYNSIIGISNFWKRLNPPLVIPVSILKTKLWKLAIKWENNMIFDFSVLFPKCKFLRLQHFFSRLMVIQSTHFFSGSTYLQERRVWWNIFPLSYQNAYVHQTFQGGDIREEITPINLHDTSLGLSCEVTWQIKYMSPFAEDPWIPN